MTTPERLWTYSAAGEGRVNGKACVVVLGWDVADPSRIAICATGREPVWVDRGRADDGVGMSSSDRMWENLKPVRHVAFRAPDGDTVLVRGDMLARFVAGTERWVSPGHENFDDEAAALFGVTS